MCQTKYDTSMIPSPLCMFTYRLEIRYHWNLKQPAYSFLRILLELLWMMQQSPSNTLKGQWNAQLKRWIARGPVRFRLFTSNNTMISGAACYGERCEGGKQRRLARDGRRLFQRREGINHIHIIIQTFGEWWRTCETQKIRDRANSR